MQLLFINEEFCHFLFTRPLMIRKEIIENRIWKMEVHFSRSVVCSSLQHTRPPYPSTTLRVYSNSCPLSGWYHPTISSSVVPFSSCFQIFPASGSFLRSQVAKVFELQLQHQSFQWIFRVDLLYYWLVWSPCNLRDSQELSLTPQMKYINSSVLSLLYGPTVISVRDYWKNHSFGYMDLCQQSDISPFC